MKTKKLLIYFLFWFCCCQLTLAQPPVPEDYFDLFDPDASDDDEGQDDQSDPYKLDVIQEMLGMTGAVGDYPNNAISNYKLVNEGCDATYVCMYNTLKKVFSVYRYEYIFRLKKLTLSCEDEKKFLQDYALFLLTLNLDIYCIEHLHRDGNKLEDVELVNAMLAMRDIRYDFVKDDFDKLEEKLPMLDPYIHIRTVADPFCSEELNVTPRPCDCGDYYGTIDENEKNRLLEDIETIINHISPMWQAAKAIKINERLNTLPCD